MTTSQRDNKNDKPANNNNNNNNYRRRQQAIRNVELGGVANPNNVGQAAKMEATAIEQGRGRKQKGELDDWTEAHATPSYFGWRSLVCGCNRELLC